jgi:hypothetical protein
MNKSILNMLGLGNKDPREEEYLRWLQLQGGGGVPNISDYQTVVPEAGPAPEEITMDQAGYDEAMGEYDWKRKLENMQNKRFYAGLSNVFAPRYPKQPRVQPTGPASRAFPEYMRMRYWS